MSVTVSVCVVEVEQFHDVGVGRDRRLAAAGLEAESGLARGDEVEFALQASAPRGQREEVVELGRDLLGAPEERVAKTH